VVPPKERGGALGAYSGAVVAAYAGGYLIAGRLASSYGGGRNLMDFHPGDSGRVLIALLVRNAPPGEEDNGDRGLIGKTMLSQASGGTEGTAGEILEAPFGD